MPRLAHLLIAAVLAVGLGVPLAQSQTDQAPPAAGQTTTPAAKGKKGLTAEEKAKAKEERKAARKQEREQKAAAKKAKAQECRAQGKQQALKGKDLRSFVKSCVTGAPAGSEAK
jgi:uncharacterized protein HemX